MNKFTPEKRSKIMSAIRSRDTLPEIVVRKWLGVPLPRLRQCETCDWNDGGRPGGCFASGESVLAILLTI